jgi:hypothetical protein
VTPRGITVEEALQRRDEWVARWKEKLDMDEADLDNRFDYHRPSENQTFLHNGVRSECRRLADMLNRALPESREKSLAITHLEETMMWANAAVARN